MAHNLSAAPGANSTIKFKWLTADQSYVTMSATSTVNFTREQARIDVTGFGDSSRKVIKGLLEVVEITFSTYADVLLVPGDEMEVFEVLLGSGADLEGSAIVLNGTYSGDVDGACSHEYTVVLNNAAFIHPE